jgi:hypothetical protein
MGVTKTRVGVWASGLTVTRFVLPSYYREVTNEDMVE